MKKLKNVKTRFENTLMLRMGGVTPEITNLKKEAGDHLLEVLGVIIIAVVILIFFREQITALFQNAVTKATTSVNKLFDNISST